ncbi:MAG: M4 family metallopeptidase [Bdellovibrionota bacterium]
MKHIHAVLFSLSLFLFPFTSFAQEMSQGQKIEIEKDDLRDRVYSVRIKDNTFGGGVNFSFSAPQITTRSSLILDYKELAKQYLATHGGHFGITDVATQFFEGEVTVDNFGMAHVRFPQAYQGVAVTNGEMIVHIRSNGALKTINGIFIKGLSGLNVTPSITEKEATAVAASYWQLKYGVSYEVDDIALVIISPSELKNKDGKSYLSWRIRLSNDGEFLDENVFIDAHTANYITYESNIRAAHGEKTPIYRRVAELAPDGQWWLNGVFPEYPGYVFGRLEGRPARGPNPYVNDGKGSGPDTVYTRLNQVHKFFQNELGINGPDGNGGIFVAESGIAKGKNVTDAYTDITWCPSNGMFSNKLHFMFCGYSKLEDLIGHEYAHAVGWGTLKYAGESGAIEEAISDLTGYRFQKYLTGSTDWVCETQTEDELPFRNSKTPGVGTLDPSPVHWYDSNTDCSRMHIMSTVASHAAYLASEGGEREGCKVRAVGIERVHNVWFHAKLNYFPSTVTYNSSISYIMDACDDLYPNTVNPEEFNPICYQIKKSMLATKMDQRGYCNDKRKIYERAPSCDFCPDNPNKDDIGCSGNCDGEADLDSDGDGTPDCYDECPNDPDKVTAGRCGCGVPEDIVDLDDDTFWGAGSCPAIRNDCDDTKFDKTAPGEPEICGDNIDNDCDGLTDEGCEEEDECPEDPNKTKPGICGCGVPDTDTDKDGTPDCKDLCPEDPNKTDPGICGCGKPDIDSDGDGVLDCKDGCPNDPNKTSPGICGCGVPDTDTDKDGTPDCKDLCPEDPNKTDPGICGCGKPDIDTDGDGVLDCKDGCPYDPNKTNPGICGCGVPDTDTDKDGTPDCNDLCPKDPNKTKPGICGCGKPDIDSDGDGTLDCKDGCPNDPNKIKPGICGCGVPDTDTDKDGTPDCNDLCPKDPNKTKPGICGCGKPDIDSDGDGTLDCKDGCPNDPNKIKPGICGCGVPDTDSDGNGIPDCLDTHDECPTDPNKTKPGICGCGVPDIDTDGDGVFDCHDKCPKDPKKDISRDLRLRCSG